MTTIDRELVKGSTVTLILTVLERGERYGYELIQELARESKGQLQPKEGTIYPVLHQLEREGAISARWGEGEGARKRRYYRITREGRKLLARKSAEWATFRAMMDGFLGGIT